MTVGMTYRIRENGKKVSLFAKVMLIEKDIKQIIPEIERSKLIHSLSRCRQFYDDTLYYGRRDLKQQAVF